LLKWLKSFDKIARKVKPNKSGDRLDENYDFSIVAKDNGTQVMNGGKKIFSIESQLRIISIKFLSNISQIKALIK
jgi:hypothetical protein